MRRLNPCRETNFEGRNKYKDKYRKYIERKEALGAQTEAARQSRTASPATEGNQGPNKRERRREITVVTHKRTNDCGGWNEWSLTSAGCFECVQRSGL